MPSHEDALTAQSFDQGWSMDDTRRMLNVERMDPTAQDDTTSLGAKRKAKWQEDIKAISTQLDTCVARHLLFLAEVGGLQAPPHSEHASTPFLEAWRRLMTQRPLENYQLMRLGGDFSRSLMIQAFLLRPEFGDKDTHMEENVAKLHHRLMSKVLMGDFDGFETEAQSCWVSGARLRLEMKGWTPTLERFDSANRKFVPLQPGDISAPTLHEVSLPVPSGTLLISDWFRHDAFNALVDKALETDHPDINSEAGCVERTQRLAQDLGIGTVYVGNSSPSIIVDPQGVRVGWAADGDAYDDASGEGEPKDMRREQERKAPLVGQEAGRVCTDMWWVTMIDKQVLVDLFARTMPLEVAQQEVDTLIAEQASDIIQVTVPKGDYHLYFAGKPEVLAQQFVMEEMNFDGFEEPMLALSASKLTPKVQAQAPVTAAKRPKP
jgi:hypothetical protein